MEDRRTLIADAAIEVVARDGIRALTHRAVDAEAGLPSGSTSYYCRSRAQLVELTCERVVALLRGYVEISELLETTPSDADELAGFLAGMVSGLLADYRGELAARWALMLELRGSQNTSELAAALLDPADLDTALEALGARDHESAAAEMLTVYEGILWERTTGRLVSDDRTESDVQRDADLLAAPLHSHSHRGGRGLFGRRR